MKTPARFRPVPTVRPDGSALRRYGQWLAVATVCLGAFLGQLTASVTALVLPELGRHFGVGFAAAEWVALAYLLVLVALLAPVGRLSDRLGRRRMYTGGFAVFAAASLGAGLAGGLAVLVACRAVQAVGAAMMQANSVALVARGVPEHAMRRALGIQAAAQGLGLALGPSLGGLLVEYASWRWVFWINVPIGVLGVLAGRFLLPPTPPGPVPPEEAGGRFDLLGLVLLAGSSAALLLALSTASGLPLPGWAVGALLLAAVLGALALTRQERRATRPIIAPGVLNTPGVRPGLVIALIGYLLLFCPLVLGPVMLAGSGTAPTVAGVVITVLPAAFALAATAGGVLLPRRWDDSARCRLGAALAGAGLALLAVLPATPAGSLLPLLVVGHGLGLLLPANNTLVMRAVPTSCAAAGGGMVNTARSLGTALGTALPVLGVHLAGPRAGGRGVLLALAAVAAGAAAFSRPASGGRSRGRGRGVVGAGPGAAPGARATVGPGAGGRARAGHTAGAGAGNAAAGVPRTETVRRTPAGGNAG